MSQSRGQPEPFHVLPEFVCDAIPGPDVSTQSPNGRGANEGMTAQPAAIWPAAGARGFPQWQSLSTDELLAAVAHQRANLPPAELQKILAVAQERRSRLSNEVSAADRVISLCQTPEG